MKQNFQYKNEHIFSYTDYGKEDGYPILVQHGLIASITDCHLFDNLIKAGMRIISVARPGYGESSPYNMSQVAEWGEIVSCWLMSFISLNLICWECHRALLIVTP